MKTYTTYTKKGKTYLSPGNILLLDNILPDGTILSEDEIEFKWQFFGLNSRIWIDATQGNFISTNRMIKNAMSNGWKTRQVATLKPKVETESTDNVSWAPPTGTIVNGYVPQEKYDALVEQFNRIKEFVNQIEL